MGKKRHGREKGQWEESEGKKDTRRGKIGEKGARKKGRTGKESCGKIKRKERKKEWRSDNLEGGCHESPLTSPGAGTS